VDVEVVAEGSVDFLVEVGGTVGWADARESSVPEKRLFFSGGDDTVLSL
jgi:hypothetical protein